jgi:hypothetical protein
MKVGAQNCVTQRVRKSAGSVTSRGFKLPPKKIASMVQGHKSHDQGAEEINGVKTRSSLSTVFH